MDLMRVLRHLFLPPWRVRLAFGARALHDVERAIRESEKTHAGEICFAVESALHLFPLLQGQSARERALDVFSQLRVWDTEHNNGVLIYLLLADRDVEIIADRGVHRHVGADEWEHICRAMEAAFRAGRFDAGVIEGIDAVSRHLVRHYPRTANSANEVTDRPVIL